MLNRAAADVVPTGFGEPVATSLPSAVRRLVDAVQPQRIVLFGSYACGTPTPDSDVDLLVIWETAAAPVERFAAVSQALWPRPFPLDLLILTPVEARQALAAGEPLIREALTRGQVLYEQPD